MADSESFVNPCSALRDPNDSESLIHDRDKMPYVKDKPRNRDTVVSDFVRVKIREWVESGREQKELAIAAGFPGASTVAMVKTGQGVGAKTGPGFARAFGFASFEAMVDAAYEWRRGLGESLERRLQDEGFQAAVAALPSFIAPPPTTAEIRTIAADFVAPRFDDRESKWWLDMLANELVRDRARDAALLAAKKAARRERVAAVAAEERGWREGARKKHRVAEAAAEVAKRSEAADKDVDNMKRRRRIRAV